MDKAMIQSAQSPVQQFPRNDDAGIMKEFIHLLHEIVPLLENVRNSIEESSHRIPKATRQLSKVNQETENATVEILNVLESMSARITAAEAKVALLKEAIHHSKLASRKIALRLLDEMSETSAFSSVELTALVVNEILGSIEGTGAVTSIEEVLRETKADTMNIAMALQVQDIAAQQIASVASTIESVEDQLVRALNRFENGNAADIARDATDSASDAPRSFDTDARYAPSGERQDIADEIVRQFSKTP